MTGSVNNMKPDGDSAEVPVSPEVKKEENFFRLKKTTKFSDLAYAKETITIPESDLCFQDGNNIYQFEFIRGDNDSMLEVKPGTYKFTCTPAGVVPTDIVLKDRVLLESVTNTKAIIREAKLFFNKLDVYERLGRPKKRAVLLYSIPGMGKTSAIEKVCTDLIKEDSGTVVFVWPTSELDADSVMHFFESRCKYTEACTRLVLIMEDIGGGDRDPGYSRSAVDSGLLNLLDGVGVVFKLPTFIVATTNHPENLLASLADRPGRFDLMLRLNPPSHKEKIELMRFISKRDLNQDEQNCLGIKGTEEFSIAHLEEVAVRSELHDKTYAQVVKELIDHKKLFAADFASKDKKVGISGDD